MIGRLKALLRLALLAWLASAGLALAVGVPPPPSPDASHQILVMLRLPAEHLRAGGDYSDGYGGGMAQSARRRMVAALAHKHGLTLIDDWPMPLAGVDCFVLTVPGGTSTDSAAASLSKEPGVLWSEPMSLFRAQAGAPTHNDPLYAAQPAAREWALASLHQTATGRNVRVAVIDSQVEQNHPDLAGQVEVSDNFVAGPAPRAEAHGTGVAGVIAARADNGLGIAGMAPNARLMALRACWQTTPHAGAPAATLCDSLSLAKALSFAIEHRAQIINMSLAGPQDRLLGRLVDVAGAHRIAVVGAFDRSLPDGGFPASHPGVIAVADEGGRPTPPGVYAAPGRDVPTTLPGGHYSLVNGSSYAAAHVSGLLALLRERPGIAPGGLTLVTLAGGGAIDACATVMHNTGRCDCSCARAQARTALVRR